MPPSTFQSSAAWRYSPMLAPLAVIGLVVAVGLWMSVPELALLRGSRVADPAPPAHARSAVPTAASRLRVDPAQLSGSRLFGVIDAAQRDAAGATADTGKDVPGVWRQGDAVPEELPAAAVSVTVQGIVFEPGSGAGRVLLGGAGNVPRSYRVDDELPGGAIIRHIEARRVVVEEGGELKALILPTPHGGAPLVRNLPKPAAFDTEAMRDEFAADADQAADEDEAAWEDDPAYADEPVYEDDTADMEDDIEMDAGTFDGEAYDSQWDEADYE